MAFLFIPLFAEKILSENVSKIIEKRMDKNNKKFQSIFLTLTAPDKRVSLQKENIQFLKLMVKIKKNKNIVNQLAADKGGLYNFLKIKNHFKQWAWLGDHFFVAKFWSEKEFIERIIKYAEVDCHHELLKLLKTERQNSQKYNKIANTLKLTKLEIKTVETAKAYVYFRTDRLDMLFYSEFLAISLLMEIAKRMGLELTDFLLLTPDEINIWFKNKISFKKIINQRKKNCALILENGKLKIYSGKSAQKFKEKSEKPDNNIIIKGNAAFRGLIVGSVKIILKKHEFKKLNKGDILVTNMTTPDYVPLMKKCAGIITDEGGITCHAAIVSRELRKPCIIGTKIATKVLKDGDKVVVNANDGVIKII